MNNTLEISSASDIEKLTLSELADICNKSSVTQENIDKRKAVLSKQRLEDIRVESDKEVARLAGAEPTDSSSTMAWSTSFGFAVACFLITQSQMWLIFSIVL